MGIFKKQRFTCGGCGTVKNAKVTVRPEAATDPVAPPPGWFQASIVAQHPVFGAIGSISVFTCSEKCAAEVTEGKGAAHALVEGFQKGFAEKAEHTLVPVPDANDAPEVPPDEPPQAG